MKTLEELVLDFNQLNYEQKKEKVLNLLEFVNGQISFANGMKKYLTEHENVSESFLDKIYKIVMKIGLETHNQLNEEQKKKMQEMEKEMLEDMAKDEKEAEEIIKKL